MSQRVEEALLALERTQSEITADLVAGGITVASMARLGGAADRLSAALHRQAEHRKEALAVAADTIPQAGAKAIVAYAVTFAAFLDTGEGGE